MTPKDPGAFVGEKWMKTTGWEKRKLGEQIKPGTAANLLQMFLKKRISLTFILVNFVHELRS